MIHKALEENGSPRAQIETDEERSFFRITLAIHPEFEGRPVSAVPAVKMGLIGRLKIFISNDQAGNQTGNQAVDDESLLGMERILQLLAQGEAKKEPLLEAVPVSNQTKNVRRYLDPLEATGLIEKTLPEKPTSPKQQYRLTSLGKTLIQGAF